MREEETNGIGKVKNKEVKTKLIRQRDNRSSPKCNLEVQKRKKKKFKQKKKDRTGWAGLEP